MSAATYTGNQTVSGVNQGAHHWSFRLTTTIVYNYPGNGYITSASNATITNKVCLPPIPTGTACKIEASQSNKSISGTTATYIILVSSYFATQWGGWQYVASSTVTATVSSRGRANVDNYDLVVDSAEDFVDPTLIGTFIK